MSRSRIASQASPSSKRCAPKSIAKQPGWMSWLSGGFVR
ncbi:hypothetical protein I551_6486 [Mycobacterium ulcerans str. Harvey]|uniref:Uncharacterized protein n=1 Tax=Mycobacterium ulcerans str. Harvey TaxID=1299332 RepID=A0ABP3A8S5_MYCUL|nr:hypothetical protein I551_6486 [Mycobacterium ulcerans str. Harvey]